MNLLLPMDNNNKDDAKLCSFEVCKAWALVKTEEGNTQSIEFFNSKEEISEPIDIVIVNSQSEYVSELLLEGMMVLVAPFQQSIEDVIEAFMFRELHEIHQ